MTTLYHGWREVGCVAYRSSTLQQAHVFYFVPRILYKTAHTSCKTPYAWSIIRSKREQGGYITMRHTTATHGGHVSKRAAEQATVGLDIQRSKQHRTSKSERQPVLYGPELKIIHTPRTRSPAAKVAQKHISEMIPATKAVQTAQAAKATPQSPAKSQPRMAPGATQAAMPRPAHQPATLHTAAPQKTVATHHATAPTTRITKHHRPVARRSQLSQQPLHRRAPKHTTPLSIRPRSQVHHAAWILSLYHQK